MTRLGLATLLGVAAAAGAQNECLVEFREPGGAQVEDGRTLCGRASGKTCTFDVKLCLSHPEKSCAAGAIKRRKVKLKAKGSCGGSRKLKMVPSADSETCGSTSAVIVKTKKKGRSPARASSW